MRKLFYVIFLILCSCNSKNDSKSDKPIDLNWLQIDSEIIKAISRASKKETEKSSVIRYRAVDSTLRVFKQYDSLVPGVKFKFVNEKTAFKIIDKYFDKVRESNNYLFLTNLDFDDSYKPYYDIVVAQVSNQFELIKFVGTEPVNYGLSNDDVIKWFRKKQTEFDFDITIADLSRIEAKLKSNPKSFEKLGTEIYEFCPDVIDQGHSDINELVEYLKSSKHMWFWWD